MASSQSPPDSTPSPSPNSSGAAGAPSPDAVPSIDVKLADTDSPLVRPKLTGPDDTARRASVAFLPTANEGALPSAQKKDRTQRQQRPKQTAQKASGGAGTGRKTRGRRMSSPPPPPVFRSRVSFDTFDTRTPVVEENSFTLMRKHKDYEYTRRSRTFLVGLDSNDYSEYALEWLVDELVDDGDEIVCLRVLDKDAEPRGRLSATVDTGRYKREARDLMAHIEGKIHLENKAVNLVLEFAVGKVNKVIADMITLYEPAILIVGTRGRSLGGFQGLLPGSVSKYCLQHSPVPVIVVRPNTKREQSKRKRERDPSRHAYKDLVDRPGAVPAALASPAPLASPPPPPTTSAPAGAVPAADVAGTESDSPPDAAAARRNNAYLVGGRRGHILDPEHRNEIVAMPPDGAMASAAEAAAVAAAIGFADPAASPAVMSSSAASVASPPSNPAVVEAQREAAMAALTGGDAVEEKEEGKEAEGEVVVGKDGSDGVKEGVEVGEERSPEPKDEGEDVGAAEREADPPGDGR